MKKFLLIAAMAALAIGASADGYKIEQVWEVSTPNSLIEWANTRQGFGMDGKFYINDKGTQTIYIFDENGKSETTLPGGPNCGISRDEAGHILISTWAFPGNAFGGGIRVIDPATGETLAEYTIPVECGFQGRCDFIGFAKGDMTQDGALYLTGGNTPTDPYTAGVAIFTVTEGEVDVDNCYLAPVDGLVGINTTVINYYKDLNGEDALAYAYRSGAPSKLTFDDQGNINREALTLPDKGNSNGLFPLVWDGKEMFIYTTAGSTNYLDCFAISEAGAEAPILEVPQTVSAPINNFQANWLNAEIDADGVTIYHYYPGGYIKVYRLTKEVPVYTVASNILNDWAISEENNMVLGENGIYSLTKDSVEIAGGTMIEYKVTSNGTWWPADFNAEYYIGETGLYKLVFSFNPDGGIVGLEVTKIEEPEPEMIYTVVGPAHVFGTEWDPTDVNNDMAMGEDGIYTWTKNGVQLDDFFGFKIVGNHSWDYEWPIGYENNWNAYLPDGAGVYNIVITYDPAEPEEKITCTLTKAETPEFLRGDVDDNGEVKIGDVTALINYLLSGNAEGVNLQAADCDQNGEIKIGDVTTLINYLLSGTWPE